MSDLDEDGLGQCTSEEASPMNTSGIPCRSPSRRRYRTYRFTEGVVSPDPLERDRS